MVNILVRGQTCSKGWSLDCSLQKRPICREGVMEAQRNRGLCNLSKFAATTIIRRLTQSGEWEALDVKECVKRGRRWGVKLNYFSWYESHDRGFWSCDPPLYNCPPCDSLIRPLTALLQPLILQPHPPPPSSYPHKAADKSAPLLDRVHNAYLGHYYLLLPHTTW